MLTHFIRCARSSCLRPCDILTFQVIVEARIGDAETVSGAKGKAQLKGFHKFYEMLVLNLDVWRMPDLGRVRAYYCTSLRRKCIVSLV